VRMETIVASALILAVGIFFGRMWPKETFIVLTHGFFIFVGASLGFLTSVLLIFSELLPTSDLLVVVLTALGALGGLLIAGYLRRGLQISPYLLAQLHEHTVRTGRLWHLIMYGSLGLLLYLVAVPIFFEYSETGTLSNWELDSKLLALLAFLFFMVFLTTRKNGK